MDRISKEIRENILRIAHHSGHGHIPTCFSIIEMLRAVYESMRYNPKQPDYDERDIFILSKGHAALGLYCTLARYGYFPISDVFSLGVFGSNFGCHADRFKIPGIELSTGSLGHGIGVAAGMALGFKLSGNSRKVFVLIGDGEANEGSVWETAMVTANLHLDNLTILFDNNRSQSRCLPVTNPEEKFTSFGLKAMTVDGHDVSAIKEVVLCPVEGTPRAIVAQTTKGMGCPTLVRDVFAWHRRSPNSDELKILLGELNETSV
ncbi:MAG: transketolase [Proteobacteria bacterium]|nr:transketolase [Pseudomonadota bacterium]